MQFLKKLHLQKVAMIGIVNALNISGAVLMNVFIFGPSCSGKSSLSKTLQESLGDEWTYLDRDDLTQKEGIKEEDADEVIDQRLGNRFIIDAQIPWREKKAGEFYFLIFPPLEELLKRDALRTKNLNREEKFAQYAKKYVIETHQTLKEYQKDCFNHCFDSSQRSLLEEVEKIQTCLHL